jgi:hypothetical protein
VSRVAIALGSDPAAGQIHLDASLTTRNEVLPDRKHAVPTDVVAPLLVEFVVRAAVTHRRP